MFAVSKLSDLRKDMSLVLPEPQYHNLSCLQAAQQVNDPDKIREATDAVQGAENALNNARAAVKQTQADIARCNKELKTAQSEWTKTGVCQNRGAVQCRR